MKRFFKAIAVAAAGVAVALAAPVSAWAACPGNVPFSQAGGGIFVPAGSVDVGGTFWIAGGGIDAVGPGDTTGGFGNDAGSLAGIPVNPVFGGGGDWMVDFIGDNTTRLIFWDWASSGSDGCGNGLGACVGGSNPGTACTVGGTDCLGGGSCSLAGRPAMVVVARDDHNNFAVMQVAPSGAASYDFDTINNGGDSPFGGVGNGVTLGRAVKVNSSADVAGKVQLNVAALVLKNYDDLSGARAVPGTPRLKGVLNGAPVTVAGGGGGAITVDPESNLCWELVDAGYTATLGCVRVGTSNASQNLANGKADFSKGGAHFSWDVTAQFDVLGFNIYQKDATKGTERKVNATLIPLSGENDATPESYTYTAARRDLRAVKGGFQIELVRQNGETIRGSVQVTR